MEPKLYEILVPTVKPNWMPGKNRFFTRKYHQLWDAKVIAIAKGLTILQPTRGAWVSLTGEEFRERSIPVRIACTEEQIIQIMDLTAEHYQQLAIMAYPISEKVLIRHYKQEH